MELRHLRYFLAVAEELNFTKAAEKLFISQPPLSRQIKDLEQEVGTPLFTRDNRNVALTEAGKFLEREVKETLHQLETALAHARKIGNNISGDYKVAYTSSTFSDAIPQLVAHLSERYPYLNIKLFEESTAQQLQALEEGRLDLGILRAGFASPKIDIQPLYRDSFSVVYNPAFRSWDPQLGLLGFAKETFVFFNKQYAPTFYSSLMHICAHYGFSPNVVHQSNNINSILELVRNGLGVSIVPSSLGTTHAHPELRFMALEDVQMFTEVVLATPRGRKSVLCEEAIAFLKQKKAES